GVTNNASDIATNATAIALNTAKEGITTEQGNAITANTFGVSTNASAIAGIQTDLTSIDNQALSLDGNTLSLDDGGSVDVSAATAVATNTAAIALNTDKTSITTEQATAITANTSGVTNNASDIAANITAILANDADIVTNADAIALNTLKETHVNTDLSVTVDGDGMSVNSSDGTDATLTAADTDSWGLMTDEMFDQLEAATSALDGKENSSNKSIDVTTDGISDDKFPSVKAVKTYVDSQVSGASTQKDNVFTLQDETDATKQAQFQLSGISTGNIRTLTLPDAEGTLALTTDLASNFTAATSETDGTAGLVTQPLVGDEGKYLKGDGTWADVTPTVTADNVNLLTPVDIDNDESNETTVEDAITKLIVAVSTSAYTNVPVLTNSVTTHFALGQTRTVNFDGYYFSPTSTLENLPSGYVISSKTWVGPTSMSFTIQAPNTVSSSNDEITLSSHTSPNSEDFKITFETIDIPEIGDEYGGGIVFYLEESDGKPTGHGLVIAKELISSEFTTDWGCYGSVISGAADPGFGTWSNGVYSGGGKSNTADILADCSEPGIAAEVCSNYSITDFDITYNDWFLPSRGELSAIYSIKSTLESVSGFIAFQSENHASSTEYGNGAGTYGTSTIYGECLNFLSGAQGGAMKNATFAVRPIRAF
ncbi:DUF1566 domain-containing protein, partial [Flavobacteriales bacterium]|nr:DUF1566 domain-containing protein [Flavobacteriales bacterium]